ncbi:hypothetical protein RIF29_27152 [Crotalaria pallida]|uniref:Replication factor A C-terminal domain-containing protein n=1 Tax=Crotalaria pallida TaxID=3830 RepID=A0AAN9EVS7_CROPI
MASRKNTSSSTDKRILISEGKKPATECCSIVPTQGPSQTQYSEGSHQTGSRNSLMDPTIRRSLLQIRQANEPGKYTVLATVNEILEDNNWCYNACSKCSKQIRHIIQNGIEVHYCPKCLESPNLIVPRYKVQIGVMDSTGTACFVLFDKEAFRKFNKTALEMREQLLQVAGDEFGYPEDLYQILNKQFVFLVEVSQRFNIELNRDNYGILFMSDLDEHLEDFRKFVMENQALLQLSSPLHDGENKEIMAVASDNVRIN